MGFVMWGSWWIIIVGNLLIYTSAPMAHNVIGLIANTWFPEKERATASALMIMANTISVVVAFVIQGYYSGRGFFPSNAQPGDPVVIKGIEWILIVQSVITTGFVLFFVITFREKPKHPPSKLALNISEHFDGTSLWSETANMMKIRNFVLLCVTFSIMYASVSAIGVCM